MITVDLDNPSELRLLISYFNAKQISDDVTIKRTRKGYHIYLPVEVDGWKALDIRAYLADDEERLWLTYLRARILNEEPLDVVFYRKMYRGRWVYEEEYNPLHKPFWMPRTCIKPRVR